MQISLQNRGMINFFYHCIVTVLFYGGPLSQCVNSNLGGGAVNLSPVGFRLITQKR